MTDVFAHRVSGKKALITGAAGGLGAATARMLARHGAKVFLTDLDGAGVSAVTESIMRIKAPGRHGVQFRMFALKHAGRAY
jgi:NAD(P)-dependent dehydrogenase (short-subunit alcohol dehydrogenase family)